MDSNELSFKEYNRRFRAAALDRGGKVRTIDNGGIIVRLNPEEEPKLAIMSGIHGDERAGPLALLHWIENSKICNNKALWICPLVNDLGWDRNLRRWSRFNLNVRFEEHLAPKFISQIMRSLRRFKPDVFIDLHEDDETKYPYLFKNVEEGPQTFISRLEKKIHSKRELWQGLEEWKGSSENWAKIIGVASTTTLETPRDWGLDRRIKYHLNTLRVVNKMV